MGKSFEEWKIGDPMINERDYWQDPNYVAQDPDGVFFFFVFVLFFFFLSDSLALARCIIEDGCQRKG